MSISSMLFPLRHGVQSAPREGFGKIDEALDRATIAELSSRQIAQLTHLELGRVVRAAGLPETVVYPERLDRKTLERMVYLARLACRNRL